MSQRIATIGRVLYTLSESSLHEALYQVAGSWLSDPQRFSQVADSDSTIQTQRDQHLQLSHRQIETLPVLLAGSLEIIQTAQEQLAHFTKSSSVFFGHGYPLSSSSADQSVLLYTRTVLCSARPRRFPLNESIA